MQIGSLSLSNHLLLAPLAGVSDLPYRLIMRRYGVGLAFTEMISANGLIRAGRNSEALLYSTAADRPLGVQIFGEDPQVLAKAATLVDDCGDLIDLNLGCPVKKVVRSGAGSALMRDPLRVARILAAVRRAVRCPVTVKIRSGWDADSVNYLEIGRIVETEGADAVTLHPRTRSQAFTGKADWSQIHKLKQTLRIPVIGSGDINSPEDARRMLQETGCDAIMLGRGCYGNPWLIENILAGAESLPSWQPGPVERLDAVRAHVDLFVTHFGRERAHREMRKHLCWYSRGLSGAAAFRTRINQTLSFADLWQVTESFFLKAAKVLER